MASSPTADTYVTVKGRDKCFSGDFKYHGEVLPGTETRHGRGKCAWVLRTGMNSGGETTRYEGSWKNNRMSGLGTITLRNGVRYECEWRDGDLAGGRCTLWMRDGARCFEGSTKGFCYANGCFPERGAMMEANGDVFYVQFDRWMVLCEGVPIGSAMDLEEVGVGHPSKYELYRNGTWEAVATRAKTRKLAGRVVTGGTPVPGRGVRAACVELSGGGTYWGAMRGLAFCGEGVLVDAGGAAWRVRHADAGETFAEGQTPAIKEVRQPPAVIG